MIVYTTADAVFAYGGSAGAGTSPTNERSLMDEVIIPGVSRAVDRFCHQDFSAGAVTDARLIPEIDQDGTLTLYPPVPTLQAVTNLRYRVGGSTLWLSPGGTLDSEDRRCGAVVRLLGCDLSILRRQRLSAKLDYAGGWASLDEVPDDFRLAATAACWYEFQRRSAPMDKTAMQTVGIVVIPSDWPPHIKRGLAPYVKVTA